jgi:hypothetical protein
LASARFPVPNVLGAASSRIASFAGLHAKHVVALVPPHLFPTSYRSFDSQLVQLVGGVLCLPYYNMWGRVG